MLVLFFLIKSLAEGLRNLRPFLWQLMAMWERMRDMGDLLIDVACSRIFEQGIGLSTWVFVYC